MKSSEQSLAPSESQRDDRYERVTTRAKTDAVLRLLKGESVEAVSRELGVSVHASSVGRIDSWRRDPAELARRRDGSSRGWLAKHSSSIWQWSLAADRVGCRHRLLGGVHAARLPGMRIPQIVLYTKIIGHTWQLANWKSTKAPSLGAVPQGVGVDPVTQERGRSAEQRNAQAQREDLEPARAIRIFHPSGAPGGGEAARIAA